MRHFGLSAWVGSMGHSLARESGFLVETFKAAAAGKLANLFFVQGTTCESRGRQVLALALPPQESRIPGAHAHACKISKAWNEKRKETQQWEPPGCLAGLIFKVKVE